MTQKKVSADIHGFGILGVRSNAEGDKIFITAAAGEESSVTIGFDETALPVVINELLAASSVARRTSGRSSLSVIDCQELKLVESPTNPEAVALEYVFRPGAARQALRMSRQAFVGFLRLALSKLAPELLAEDPRSSGPTVKH